MKVGGDVAVGIEAPVDIGTEVVAVEACIGIAVVTGTGATFEDDIGIAVVVVEACIGIAVVTGIGAAFEDDIGTAVDVSVKTVVAKQESTVNSRY